MTLIIVVCYVCVMEQGRFALGDSISKISGDHFAQMYQGGNHQSHIFSPL